MPYASPESLIERLAVWRAQRLPHPGRILNERCARSLSRLPYRIDRAQPSLVFRGSPDRNPNFFESVRPTAEVNYKTGRELRVASSAVGKSSQQVVCLSYSQGSAQAEFQIAATSHCGSDRTGTVVDSPDNSIRAGRAGAGVVTAVCACAPSLQ
jgi:hypothetical protein